MRFPTIAAAACLGGTLVAAGACTANRPQVSVDLSTGLDVATAAEVAYAARATADPKVVAQASRMLAGAQAAVSAWEASTSSADQAIAAAAVAALMTYEAAAVKAS